MSGHAGHHHHHEPGRALGVGVALNMLFIVAEVAGGLWAGSLALLADAAHNLADALGLLLAGGALWLTQRAATERRTYGWRKSSVLAALANALLLALLTGGMLWESLLRLRRPVPVVENAVIVIALLGVAINGVTALGLRRFRRDDLNMRGAFLHMLGDAGISLGVAVAGVAMRLTGWGWLDPALGALIALLILVSAWRLLREALDLALDAVPRHIDPARVREYLAALPGVTAVHHLHIWPLSTTETALTVHLVKPDAAGDDELLRRLTDDLIARFGIGHATIQWERGADGAACAAPAPPAV